MTSSVFPDINVWLAMASSAHVHHVEVGLWFASLDDRQELIFCRFTQLGLLRLLTQSAVMGKRVMTQRQAWQTYDTFVHDAYARLISEPSLLEEKFRRLAERETASPNDWADSYLAAFAETAGLTLVTFDKALAARAQGSKLLGQQKFSV